MCKSRVQWKLRVVYVSGRVARIVSVYVIASVFEWWYKGVGSDNGVMKLCVWGVVGVSESMRKIEGSQNNYG